MKRPLTSQAIAALLIAGFLASDRVSAQELKDYCLAHGPAYAHPRAIVFVDAFPLAATGKIDRNQAHTE